MFQLRITIGAVPKRKSIPIALTIAGSDSGGGAGIQADLKTFAALGVHGTSAITCITAQNPSRVFGIEPCTPAMVRQQLEAVFDQLQPHAVKTGMLFSASTIETVADFFENHKRPPLIVDPVMVSSSGAALLNSDAVEVLCRRLLPLATLVTPNIHEAEILSGEKLGSVDTLRSAAKIIHERFGCASLVKGGHLQNSREAVDMFYDGQHEMLYSAPFVRGIQTHGTGCTFSAAITANLARGFSLKTALKTAKEYITNAISQSTHARRHFVLGTGKSRLNIRAPIFRKKR
jgi:hydroxymethylpyrimidine/phosphomethylpyrimidine kinase